MLKFSFNDTMKLCMAVVLLVGCASANAAVTRDYDAIATKAARFFIIANGPMLRQCTSL